MPYTVEITTPPVKSADEEQLPEMYQLPEPFDTVADAKEAAIAHIASLDLEPAAVVYNVFDREGFTVASNIEQPADAE
jgi:hypothetical protein